MTDFPSVGLRFVVFTFVSDDSGTKLGIAKRDYISVWFLYIHIWHPLISIMFVSE
jgi:hypothetical protein